MRNRYRVNKKQWAKFGAVGQAVFNQLYASMTRCPWVYQAGSLRVPTRAWRIVAWNAAFVAASEAKKAAS